MLVNACGIIKWQAKGKHRTVITLFSCPATHFFATVCAGTDCGRCSHQAMRFPPVFGAHSQCAQTNVSLHCNRFIICFPCDYISPLYALVITSYILLIFFSTSKSKFVLSLLSNSLSSDFTRKSSRARRLFFNSS